MNLTIPNLLSLLRMGLIPVFIIAALEGRAERALVIFCVAGITDLLDGFIARFFNQATPLGAYLDPVADKLLLMSAYVLLSVPGDKPWLLIPVWVTVLVIVRDVLILAIALVLYLALGISKFEPSWVSKFNTLFQIIAIILVLATGLEASLAEPTEYFLYAVAALTIISGLSYVSRANALVAEHQKPE